MIDYLIFITYTHALGLLQLSALLGTITALYIIIKNLKNKRTIYRLRRMKAQP